MNSVDSFVGRRIRVFRLMHGISQADLASHLAITVPQLDAFEDGFARISAIQLFRLAARMNVPVTAFFDGIGMHDDWHSPPQAAHHYTRASLVLEHFGALTDAQQDMILRTMQMMAASARSAAAAPDGEETGHLGAARLGQGSPDETRRM